MKKIYSYAFLIKERLYMDLPKGAQVLTAQNRNEVPTLWCIVDPAREHEQEIRTFYLASDGFDFDPENMTYISTFQMNGGARVFHLFEMKN